MNRRIFLLPTGAANTASMTVALERLGAEVCTVSSPDTVRAAPRLVVPGVGAFGPAMSRLRRDGVAESLADRLRTGRPTLLVCLGLQLLAERSEESPGIPGLGLVSSRATPFPSGLRSPQQGWNRVEPDGGGLVAPGHAYFSNGFRLIEAPAGWQVSWSDHGGRFIAALERGSVLACQFHPELSGDWGVDLLERWFAAALPDRTAAAAAPPTAASVYGRPHQDSSESTLAVRLVPCLDVRDGRVVKGVRFRGLRDAGDPAVLAAAYAGAAADELVLLDVSATPEGRATAVRTVREVRRVLPLPLTVGGGVRSVDDAVRLLDAGADKVAVNTAAVENPELLTALAARCGRQCVVVAVDAARGGDLTARPPSRAHRHAVTSPRAGQKDGRGWKVVVRSGRRRLDLDAVAWCRRAVEAGAGEILLTSWDRDGTGDGYDSELIAAVRAEVEVSIVASGGAGRAEHLAAAVAAGADAVLLASRLHLGELSIAELKAFLFHRGFEVRS